MTTAAVGSVVMIDPKTIILGENGRWDGIKELPVNELLESIRANGQDTACDIFFDAKGRPNLISGHRRLRVALELGIQLRCQVCEPVSPLELFRRTNRENVKRLHLSPMDKAVGTARFEKLGLKRDEIAAEYGCSGPYVSMLKSLLSLVYPAQILLHKGKLSSSKAIAMGKMDKAVQLKECEDIEEGSSKWADPVELTERASGSADGDQGTIAPPSVGDSQKTGEEVMSTPKKNGSTGSLYKPTVKGLKDCILAILADVESDGKHKDALKLVYAYCDNVIMAEELQASCRKGESKDAVKGLEEKKDAQEAALAEETARKTADRQAKNDKAKHAKEASRKKGVEKLLKAGWTHVKDNEDRWSRPNETSQTKLSLGEALAELP